MSDQKPKFKNLADKIKKGLKGLTKKKNQDHEDFDEGHTSDQIPDIDELPSAFDSDTPPTEFKPRRKLSDRIKASLQAFTEKIKKKRTQEMEVAPLSKPKSGLSSLLKKVNPSALGKSLYDPASRPTIHRAFIVSSVAVLTYSSGKIAADFLRGDQNPPAVEGLSMDFRPLKNHNADLQKIAQANVFKASTEEERAGCQSNNDCGEGFTCQVGKCIKKKKIDTSPCTMAKSKSNLSIKIKDTVVLQDSAKSVASLESGKKFKSVREGDTLDGVAKIGKIDRLRLIFRNLRTGDCEYVESNKAKSKPLKFDIVSPTEGKKLISENKPRGIKTDGNNFEICGSYMDRQLSDFSSLLTQAKADPFPNPDGSLSFKLSQVQPGGVFSYLGIQNGDVITRINGNKIKSMQEVMGLFNKLANISRLSLGVERGGEETAFSYNFDKSPDCESKDEQ
jgi:type II secretion system protein C